jgi:hypothetical protein
MASISSNPPLARSRSIRAAAAANSSKPLQPAIRNVTTATAAISSSATGSGIATTSHSPILESAPHVSIFLTNLRLLDLDLLPDWPDITAQTFAPRDAAQGQKKRIRCVEWTLYQLFALWDPEDTRAVCDLCCVRRRIADLLFIAVAVAT